MFAVYLLACLCLERERVMRRPCSRAGAGWASCGLVNLEIGDSPALLEQREPCHAIATTSPWLPRHPAASFASVPEPADDLTDQCSSYSYPYSISTYTLVRLLLYCCPQYTCTPSTVVKFAKRFMSLTPRLYTTITDSFQNAS